MKKTIFELINEIEHLLKDSDCCLGFFKLKLNFIALNQLETNCLGITQLIKQIKKIKEEIG